MKLSTQSILFRATPLAAIGLLAGFTLIDSTSAVQGPELAAYPPAHFDIKPGSCPNPVNVNAPDGALEIINGAMVAVIPMSIIGNKFDVDQVTVGSVSLSRVGFDKDVVLYPIQVNYGDTGTPFEGVPCDCHALAGDGELDLDLKFDKAEVVAAFELLGEEDGAIVELQISGVVKGEIEFSAVDCIRIINH